MFGLPILKQFTKLSLHPAARNQVVTRNISSAPILYFKISNPLCAEPMKKKKKMDPQILKAREDRRRKKLEKQIRRLQKNARQLKPIDELEVPLHIIDQMEKRKRPPPQLTAAEVESRQLLQKEWSRYKRQEHISHVAQIDRIMSCQRRALDQLYEVSEELYDEAIMPDLQLIPYSIKGPVATPPIKNYESPDGEFIDVSKKWDS